MAYGGMAYGGHGQSQPMMMANGRELTKADFAYMQDMDDEKAERQLNEIKAGVQAWKESPYLPEERPCRDCLWALFFLVTVGGVIGTGVYFFEALQEEAQKHIEAASEQESIFDHVKPEAIIGSSLAGAAGGTIAAILFIMLAHSCPACVVYTSLFFGPCMTILTGLVMIGMASTAGEAGMILMIMGAVCVFFGLCMLTCVFCCWWQYIPFMIVVTECVAGVAAGHLSMVAVALMGCVLGIAWVGACAVSFIATYLEYQERLNSFGDDGENEKVHYAIYFFCVLIFVWGGQVVSNVCHVTYCGVFARWYYHGDGDGMGREAMCFPSLWVALGPSFGSICLGSFLVALVRAVEAVVRQMRNQAQEEGNLVMCVILMILECVISCIGDILEYFNTWAYVQCAVRGVNFCEAARITMGMVKWSNCDAIISDLLLDSVVTMGSFLCGSVAALVGVAAAYSSAGEQPIILGSGAICGFLSGIIAGEAALGIIGSGVKTILMCWADSPDRLARANPDVAAEFQEKSQRLR